MWVEKISRISFYNSTYKKWKEENYNPAKQEAYSCSWYRTILILLFICKNPQIGIDEEIWSWRKLEENYTKH